MAVHVADSDVVALERQADRTASRFVGHGALAERLAVSTLAHDNDMFNVRLQYGLMENPNVPEAMEQTREQDLALTVQVILG